MQHLETYIPSSFNYVKSKFIDKILFLTVIFDIEKEIIIITQINNNNNNDSNKIKLCPRNSLIQQQENIMSK